MKKQPATHRAYAVRWERGPHPRSPRVAQLLEIGDARIEGNARIQHRIHLDRLPIGGFDGKVFLVPIDEKPDDLAAQLTSNAEAGD